MSYFSEHYPFYVPPHISGIEKVRITIMKPTPTQEMEQRINMRYAFAMSSFARMHGVRNAQSNHSIHRFCVLWSESNLTPPLGNLTTVDFYFRDLIEM
jgi:hypothetical protein